MALSIHDIVYVAIGFVLLGVLTPIGLGYCFSIYNNSIYGNSTAMNTAVLT